MLPDGVVQPRRLRLRFHAKLPLQAVAQGLVQLQGLRHLAALGMQLHQHAAGRLAQGIERKQSPRRRFGALALSGRHRPGEQLPPELPRQLAQPLPLDQQPVLEGRRREC